VSAPFGGSGKEVMPMTTSPVRVERRVGQRFSYPLPVSLCQPAASVQGVGFTQDVSSRGVFLFTDAPLSEGDEIELTLRMPSEITLGESMPVRCRGRILRLVRPVAAVHEASGSTRAETKIGVAVRLEDYEYLTECSESSASYARISTLHHHHDEDQPMAVQSSTRPAAG
jgi:PilZ domain-containing protein